MIDVSRLQSLDPKNVLHACRLKHDLLADLQNTQVLNTLKNYDPRLAGTFPLNLQTEDSDIDIVCQTSHTQNFASEMKHLFSDMSGLQITVVHNRGLESVVVSFQSAAFAYEIYAENQPSTEQYAYVHMLIEARLLNMDPKVYEKIKALKAKGYKTEPAFAHAFGLQGDPYLALYNLHQLTDEELIMTCSL